MRFCIESLMSAVLSIPREYKRLCGEKGEEALTTLVQPFGGRVTEVVRLRDLGKAGDLAAFLYPVPYRVRRELELVSDADAVCFANSLAEDELLVERLPER
jgi:hypothetical protein